MSTLPVIETNQMNDSLITIDELANVVGQTKLTVQKKINGAKLQTVAMLRTGKPGRPARLFNRSEVNALFDIQTSLSFSQEENQLSKTENNQVSNLAQQNVSTSP